MYLLRLFAQIEVVFRISEISGEAGGAGRGAAGKKSKLKLELGRSSGAGRLQTAATGPGHLENKPVNPAGTGTVNVDAAMVNKLLGK